MAGNLLLDTGPWVALVDRSDRSHAACRTFLEEYRGNLLSTEPVLTETLHLLARVHGGAEAALEFVLRGAVTLVPSTVETLRRCWSRMAKYRDVPMDFADAGLVVLAEEAGTDEVFTLDRRGFATYRLHGRRGFTIRP